MLVELSSRNIPVAVMSAPLNESTCAELNPSIQKNFVAYLRAATRHVPGVQMVGPTMPCWPNRLFGDQFHLNAEGANQYSKMVGQWLQSYIALSDNARPLVER
jgi:lysophospholipase L1-like esterase